MSRLLPLLCVACVEAATVAPMPVQATPPVLSATPFEPGQFGSLIVEGADPFEVVHFIRGTTNAPGPCIQTAGNLCLDIADVLYMGRRRADGTGRASFIVQLPANVPPGAEAWFQSVLIRGPASVKTQALYAQVSGDDLDGDGFDQATDCDDTDPAINPVALEVCDGVDNDCDPSTTEDGLILVDGQSITAPYAIDQALTQVAPGGTVELCAGTFPMPQTHYLDTPVTIRGQGMGETILDGQDTAAVGFYVTNVGVELVDLTITGIYHINSGHAVQVRCPQGAACEPSDVLLRRVELKENFGYDGSAVHATYGGAFRMEDSRILANEAARAAVFVQSGSHAEIVDTDFWDNVGFIDESALNVSFGSTVYASGLSFLRNDGWRQAIYMNATTFECEDCEFGAGLDDNTPGDMVIQTGTFSWSNYDWYGVESVACNVGVPGVVSGCVQGP
jgi:hypothetical protein